VSISNLTANGSTAGTGAQITNSGAGASGGVTLTGSNTFNGSDDGGLTVYTTGAITASNLTATANGLLTGYSGVYFDAGTSAVTLTGTNVFDSNGKTAVSSAGLWIASAGNVSLTSVTAEHNLEDGFGGIISGSVSISCGSFNDNGQYGVNLSIGGPTLTLVGVTAVGNTSGQVNYGGSPTVTTVRDCPLP
jgi:hypothetical protein